MAGQFQEYFGEMLRVNDTQFIASEIKISAYTFHTDRNMTCLTSDVYLRI